MKLDQPESEEELEAEPNSDITALVLRQPQHHRKTVIYLSLSTLIFTTAFILGYVGVSEGRATTVVRRGRGFPVEDKAWTRPLLNQASQQDDPPIGGPLKGTALAAEILQTFKDLHMDPHLGRSHYATLQFPSRTQRNSLWMVDSQGEVLEEISLENPDSYCAYSAIGTATGGVVYVNYGRQEDFDRLRSAGVSVIGCVVVMRVGGGVSYAEKVLLAQKAGAGGALIYPDPADIPQDPRRLGLNSYTAISEHVHMGSGDPFTPGFPSFNHTQFPPTQSSGLPVIPAQPISANVASKLLSQLTGSSVPAGLGRAGCRTIEPDQYIIMGAQRDAWGPGAVKAGVGTAILLELARTFSNMVQNGFYPRRSLLFVSWDAGDFGNVGATEWLEGYLSMLHLKAVAYFSLDQACDDNLSAYTSPLLVDLIESAIKQVEHPKHAGQSIYSRAEREGGSWKIIKPLYLNSGAYSFTAFGGVPAMELRFNEDSRPYPFVNTPLDTPGRLQEVLGGRLGVVGRSLGELVGLMVLRLAHDHILPLRITSYSHTALQFGAQLNKHSAELQARGLSPKWVFSPRGSAKNLTLHSHHTKDKFQTPLSLPLHFARSREPHRVGVVFQFNVERVSRKTLIIADQAQIPDTMKEETAL
ncbi:hypothetical protein J4Q44_G00052980 [Coregonus suidteri]|uniref:Transferrin receptor protein 2 n=1 Tax=Coregonus suidteri TaxID=861788 RepID=A0AAN8M5Z6_9TELE